MKISGISEQDAKQLLQIRNILKRTVTELKFNLADARIVDESIQWYDKFLKFLAQIQKAEMEEKAKKKTNSDSSNSLKIKDFSPGSFPVKTSVKSRTSTKKSKSSKGKK